MSSVPAPLSAYCKHSPWRRQMLRQEPFCWRRCSGNPCQVATTPCDFSSSFESASACLSVHVDLSPCTWKLKKILSSQMHGQSSVCIYCLHRSSIQTCHQMVWGVGWPCSCSRFCMFIQHRLLPRYKFNTS